MVQRAAELVDAVARHAGRIQIGRAPTIHAKTTPLASPPAQGMVHVAENHQGQPPLLLDLMDRQRQIEVAPIPGRQLPIPPAEIGRLAAQASGTAMGQQHQRQGWIGRHGGGANPFGGFMQADGPVHRAHGLGNPETTAGGARPGAND